MTYQEWAEEIGKNRWYKQDGNARTYMPLDYQYPAIFELVTAQADSVFKNWDVPCDVGEFTSQFLARVPDAWLKFKTELEFFTGTLDGSTIDPAEFHAGTKRTITRDTESHTDETTGPRTDTQTQNVNVHEDSDTKNRQIAYQPGVQATNPTNENIGEMGTNFASQITDTVEKSTRTQGSDGDTTVVTGQQTGNRNDKGREVMKEDSEYINYYDQLAFNRERLNALESLKPFWEYFQDLFLSVQGLTPWWQCRGHNPYMWPAPGMYTV